MDSGAVLSLTGDRINTEINENEGELVSDEHDDIASENFCHLIKITRTIK